MQSSESKTKRSRKSVEEPAAKKAKTPITASEEAPKARRATQAKTSIPDTTSAVKQHRGAATKTVPSAATTPVIRESSVQPIVSVSNTAASKPAVVSAKEIATLAYSYWVARGYQGGSAEADWLRAERELSSRS